MASPPSTSTIWSSASVWKDATPSPRQPPIPLASSPSPTPSASKLNESQQHQHQQPVAEPTAASSAPAARSPPILGAGGGSQFTAEPASVFPAQTPLTAPPSSQGPSTQPDRKDSSSDGFQSPPAFIAATLSSLFFPTSSSTASHDLSASTAASSVASSPLPLPSSSAPHPPRRVSRPAVSLVNHDPSRYDSTPYTPPSSSSPMARRPSSWLLSGAESLGKAVLSGVYSFTGAVPDPPSSSSMSPISAPSSPRSPDPSHFPRRAISSQPSRSQLVPPQPRSSASTAPSGTVSGFGSGLGPPPLPRMASTPLSFLNDFVSNVVNAVSGDFSRSYDPEDIHVSRVLTNVVLSQPSSYSDWEHTSITYADEFHFYRGALIGRGKYSHVYECTDRRDGSSCVVKIFKPMKSRKFKREVLVLKNLLGGPNIVRLRDCYIDRENNEPAIVFLRCGNVNWREYYPTLQYNDVKHYMRELLRGIEYAHSKGIIHRDLKPHNICIDPVKRELIIIDWGLAEFYRPKEEFNLRVASRYFKPPEILLGYRQYDYSFDLWSVGCILAGMIFRKEVFFRGEDDTDQLRAIAAVLGGPDLREYVAKYSMTLAEDIADVIDAARSQPRQPWYEYVSWTNGDIARDDVLSFLDGLLRYDHRTRLSATEALAHHFFENVEESSTSGQHREIRSPTPGLDHTHDEEEED